MMGIPILIFRFQDYWSQLREGTRDQIIGGLIVLIIGAIGGAIWKILRRRAARGIESEHTSVQPTQQQVLVKFEGAQPSPPPDNPSDEPVISKRNIPRPPLAGFVARRDESGRDIIERLKDELLPEKEQLIVLWGAGGVGKTTLAAETARAMRDVFVSGIVWTTADGKADFSLSTMLDEIATQLGKSDLRQLAPERKDEALHQLLSTTSATLIVLDNFETISPSEQERCANWLANRASCPALITSRDQVSHARPVRILAMSLPEAREFLQRLLSQVINAQSFVELNNEQIINTADRVPQVLQWVVRQIDSAREPQAVLDELAHGKGDAAKRVFDRSFNLPQLGDDGRATLLALSLFVPSAGRLALARVAGLGSDLDRLESATQQLVQLSLVQTTAGNRRLRVEGLTRELAKARLQKGDRPNDYRRRFVECFLNYAAGYPTSSPEDHDGLELEKDNLLSAIDVASELMDWESVQVLAYRIGLPSSGVLGIRGYWTEAIKANEQGLEAARRSKSQQDISNFSHNLAVMYLMRGDFIGAQRLFENSLKIAKQMGNTQGIAATLHQLANLAQDLGNIGEARRLHSEGLSIEREIDDQVGIAKSLHQLGMLFHHEGELEKAQEHYEQSLNMKRVLGDQAGIARSLHELARLADAKGETLEAHKLLDESLMIRRELRDQRGIAGSLHLSGQFAAAEGNVVEAERLFGEALVIWERLGSPNANMTRRALEFLKCKTTDN